MQTQSKSWSGSGRESGGPFPVAGSRDRSCEAGQNCQEEERAVHGALTRANESMSGRRAPARTFWALCDEPLNYAICELYRYQIDCIFHQTSYTAQDDHDVRRARECAAVDDFPESSRIRAGADGAEK